MKIQPTFKTCPHVWIWDRLHAEYRCAICYNTKEYVEDMEKWLNDNKKN